jgi:hypothetical protein
MKTLVIHPKDPTTEFLSVIYEGKGYTVITDRDIKFNDLLKKVKQHDRIMMMGHGCAYGLIGFMTSFMNKRFIKVLRTKDCVCIWCNADKYVEREGIKGFYTGMFLSEVYEAKYFGIDVNQEIVDYSNMLFVNLMKDIIESPNILTEIKSSYIGDSPVIRFNNDRLYYKNNNERVAVITMNNF